MTNEIVPYTPNEEGVVIYRTEDNSIQLQVKLEHESVWLTQEQMAQLFQRDKTVIIRHVNNIYAEGELDRESTSAKFAFVPEKRERLALCVAKSINITDFCRNICISQKKAVPLQPITDEICENK